MTMMVSNTLVQDSAEKSQISEAELPGTLFQNTEQSQKCATNRKYRTVAEVCYKQKISISHLFSQIPLFINKNKNSVQKVVLFEVSSVPPKLNVVWILSA